MNTLRPLTLTFRTALAAVVCQGACLACEPIVLGTEQDDAGTTIPVDAAGGDEHVPPTDAGKDSGAPDASHDSGADAGQDGDSGSDAGNDAAEGGDADAPPEWEPEPGGFITAIATGNPASGGDANQAMVYVGYESGHVYRSAQGLSASPVWEHVNAPQVSDLPTYHLVTAIAIHPQFSDRVLLGFTGQTQGPKFFRTSDGQQWLQTTTGVPGEVWSVSYNPIDPSYVYMVSANRPIFSDDGGQSWFESPFAGDPLRVLLEAHPDFVAGDRITCAAAGTAPGDVYLGTVAGMVFGIENGEFRNFDPNEVTPERLITRVTPVPGGVSREIYVTFANMLQESIYVLRDTEWTNLHNSQLPNWQVEVSSEAFFGASVNPVDPDRVYLGFSSGAARSGDRGLTWLTSP